MIEALKRLEYRGYDSAGVATLEDGRLTRRRAEGKLANLEARLAARAARRAASASATRAGRPTASRPRPTPIRTPAAAVAVVHNGIIENFRELREELASTRATASRPRPIPRSSRHLVAEDDLPGGKTPDAGGRGGAEAAARRLRARHLFEGEDDLLIGARQGAPLAVGYGEGEMYLGSDALALAPFTDRVAYLEEGDWVAVTRAGAASSTTRPGESRRAAAIRAAGRGAAGRQRQLPPLHGEGNPRAAGSRRPHARPLRRLADDGASRPSTWPFDFDGLSRITIVACGTAYYAGLVAQVLVRALRAAAGRGRHRLRVPLSRAAARKDGAALVVSQSGETADTLAALRYAKAQGQKTLARRQRARLHHRARERRVLPTLAGPEIGVASTKAFTCQLAVLACAGALRSAGARQARRRSRGGTRRATDRDAGA